MLPLRFLLTLLTILCFATIAGASVEEARVGVDFEKACVLGGESHFSASFKAPVSGGKPLALGYDASTVSYQTGKIRSFTTQADEVYYRVFSGDSTAGAFLSKTKPRSADWATEAFALPPGNRADFIQEVLVPAGTRLQRSRAAPNIWGRGGAEQFEILKLRPDEFQPVQFGTGVPFR